MATSQFDGCCSDNNAREEASSSVGSSEEEEDMLLDIFDVDDDKSNEVSFIETGTQCTKAMKTPTGQKSPVSVFNLPIPNSKNTSFCGTLPKLQTSTLKLSQKLRAKGCRHHEQRWCQKNVSGAFAELRKLVPTYPVDRKLNKNEILRMTIQYIRLLISVREWQDNNIENSNSIDTMMKRDINCKDAKC